MHTLDMLLYLTDVAKRAGYEIREEWLNGIGGGPCRIKGKPLLFLDLSLGPADRLEQVTEAVREADLHGIYLLPEAKALVERAA